VVVVSMSKNQVKRDSCLMPFRFIQVGPLVAGVFAMTANPNGLSPRALVEADTWTHFRLKSLRFRLHPVSNTSTTYATAVWVPGIQDTPPVTRATSSELLTAAVLGGIASVQSDWASVSKSELSGPLPWYKTIQGTADATEEAPGQLIVIGTATETFVLEIMGVFEFKGSIATANTPAAVKLREELRAFRLQQVNSREKDRIVSVLAITDKRAPP
jgi:hypothetical protein